MKEIPFCEDCRWYRVAITGPVCTHPDAPPVSHVTRDGSEPSCASERGTHGQAVCRPVGVNFSPRQAG